MTADDKFPIFLSSLCRRAPGLEDLRGRIFEDLGRGTRIYVDEKFKVRDTLDQDDLCAADELIARIREADTFVCILAGSAHGTPIRVDGTSSRVSFFEIELVQAALLQKKVHLFVRDDFRPEPRPHALLQILKGSFPEWHAQKATTDSQILDAVARIANRGRGLRERISSLAAPAPIRRLVQALHSARTGRARTSMLFLDGAADGTVGKPRTEIVRSLIAGLGFEPHEERKLARLWIGLRELMAVKYQLLRDRESLQDWNRLLAEWARAGAWYGLHADMPLGCVAALNSLSEVRAQMNSLFPDARNAYDTSYPGGSLASAKYSIAKRLYVKQDRLACLSEALDDITRSLESVGQDRAGLFAMRGSVLRQLGHHSDAISDYETVVLLRKESKAADHEIGEALSELGFAFLWQPSPRKGLRLCEEGVALLRRGGRAGFLARGLRKLAVAYLVNGRLRRAYQARDEARAVAVSHGAFDQL